MSFAVPEARGYYTLTKRKMMRDNNGEYVRCDVRYKEYAYVFTAPNSGYTIELSPAMYKHLKRVASSYPDKMLYFKEYNLIKHSDMLDMDDFDIALDFSRHGKAFARAVTKSSIEELDNEEECRYSTCCNTYMTEHEMRCFQNGTYDKTQYGNFTIVLSRCVSKGMIISNCIVRDTVFDYFKKQGVPLFSDKRDLISYNGMKRTIYDERLTLSSIGRLAISSLALQGVGFSVFKTHAYDSDGVASFYMKLNFGPDGADNDRVEALVRAIHRTIMTLSYYSIIENNFGCRCKVDRYEVTKINSPHKVYSVVLGFRIRLK